MPKKKRVSDKRSTVTIGDISDISGNVNVAGGNITTHQSSTHLSAIDIKLLFDRLYTEIDARPALSAAQKDDIKADVKDIQTTVSEAVKETKQIDESLLSRRFRNMARMAPDILDVVVATLGNPLAGLGVALKKIAEKAKEEA